MATNLDPARWTATVFSLSDGPLRAELTAAEVDVHVLGSGGGARATWVAFRAAIGACEDVEAEVKRRIARNSHSYGHLGGQ